MNRRLPTVPHGAPVTLRFEGSDVPACAGESVPVALFASGERVLSRSIKYHRPRGFFCLPRHCGACRRTLVIEEQDRAGGSYVAHPALGVAAADRALADARAAGAEVLAASTAFAWYPEDAPRAGAPPGLLAVHTPEGLLKLAARRTLYATGAYDQNALFVDNDRPGVLAARAVGRLLTRFGILPGVRP